jgi:hypothetical protein
MRSGLYRYILGYVQLVAKHNECQTILNRPYIFGFQFAQWLQYCCNWKSNLFQSFFHIFLAEDMTNNESLIVFSFGLESHSYRLSKRGRMIGFLPPAIMASKI